MPATRFTIVLASLLLPFIGISAFAPAAADIRAGVDWNGDGLIQTQPGTRIPVDAPTESEPVQRSGSITIRTIWKTAAKAGPSPGPMPAPSRRIRPGTWRISPGSESRSTTWRSYPEDALLELAWLNGTGGDVNLYRADRPGLFPQSYLLDSSRCRSAAGRRKWCSPSVRWKI